MIKLIRFALVSMTPVQIVWTVLDMARLSGPLKRAMRIRLVRLARAGTGQPRVVPDQGVFRDYARLFSANVLEDGTEGEIWRFNHQPFPLDAAFLGARMDKADYTYRMVFLHFEWAFALQPGPAAVRFAEMHDRLQDTPVYLHPSCLSQRVFVLAWLLSQPGAPGDLGALVRPWLQHLITTTEDKAAANHRIDNDLAIALLAHLAGEDRVRAWALDGLARRTAHWVAEGHYPEKTPCYQHLLAGRARIVRACLGPSPEAEALDRMIAVLGRVPDVHVNDSYLPRACWARPGGGALPDCDYAASQDLGRGMIATVIADPLSARGYRAHAHDAAGALFVHAPDGTQLIGGLGTPTYRISAERDAARDAGAYAAPRPVTGFVPRLEPWMSFRHTAIRAPETAINCAGPATSVLITDVPSAEFQARWTLGPGEIRLWVSRPSVLEFWSDPDREALTHWIAFDGDITAHVSEPAQRFDGIGHARPATRHRLDLPGTLIIRITHDD